MDEGKPDTQSLCRVFRALSNPHRLHIYTLLLGTDCGSYSGVRMADVAAELCISASTLSHHIHELDLAGLIAVSREGKYLRLQVSHDLATSLARLLA